MCKDEMDILPYTLPRMLRQLDHVIIADNCSTDGTLGYLLEQESINAPWLTLVPDYEPAYLQSQKMTALAEMARDDYDADWIVPFDADEVWVWMEDYGAPFREYLGEGIDWHVEFAILYDHVVTSEDDETIDDPIKRIRWKRTLAAPLPKVAFRPLPGFQIEMGNHGVRYPGMVGTQTDSPIEIHHYPYRSVDQMARKARNGAAAYAAAGDRVPAGAGQHWRDYGRFLEDKGIDAIDEIFHTWFYSPDPSTDPLLIDDPCLVSL
jgi:glycosyltransferase involved in cell wall biosynthesis